MSLRPPQRIGEHASTRTGVAQDQDVNFNSQLVQQIRGVFATLGGQGLIACFIQSMSEPEYESQIPIHYENCRYVSLLSVCVHSISHAVFLA